MRKKRILIRTLTRALYAGGIVFLVSGMLLSAISTPVLAADTSSPAGFSNVIGSLFSPRQETVEPFCATCGTGTPAVTPGGDEGSSLIFAATCECGCDFVRATVCNVGDTDMEGEVDWRLYFSPNGNPQLGSVVDRGTLGPLASGECTTLDNGPGQGGNYMYRVFQEDDYEGPDSIWSSSCVVSGDCFPGPSVTPTGTGTATATEEVDETGTPTATATEEVDETGTPTGTATVPFIEVTLTPTVTATSPGEATRTRTPTTPVEVTRTRTPTTTSEPMDVNLSAICGYATDDELLWRVYNQTDEDIEYTWEVDDSDESGSGEVEAGETDYFTTSLDAETVRLFVDGELVDTETSLPYCKQELVLSHTCSPDGNGIDWFVSNPNDFGVRYGWELDGEQESSGNDLAAGTTELFTTSPLGEHTVELTWTDTRPGEHTVSQTANIETCGVVTTTPTVTRTPTATATVPFTEITVTPTVTRTRTVTATVPFTEITVTPSVTPTVTSTRTVTATVPFTEITVTPTVTPTVTSTRTITATVPFVQITVTPTVTNTQTTSTVTSTPTVTNTPTITATVPFIIVTVTPTVTQTNTSTVTSTVTQTPSQTATVPFIIVTTTGTPTVTPTETGTATGTATQTSTVTATATGTFPPPPFVVATLTPTQTEEPRPTPTFTQIVTLAPPAATSTPPIIPVTGADMLAPAMAVNLMAQFFTNLGLVMLGLALALTGITSQWKS